MAKGGSAYRSHVPAWISLCIWEWYILVYNKQIPINTLHFTELVHTRVYMATLLFFFFGTKVFHHKMFDLNQLIMT